MGKRYYQGMHMNVLSISAERFTSSANVPDPPPFSSQALAPRVAEKRAAPFPVAVGEKSARTDAERRQELETELAAANQKLAADSHEVRFEFDRDANRLVVRLVDQGTREVLRQYPSNEALRVARLIQSGKSLISMQA
jgi:flagellar protein FlaG